MESKPDVFNHNLETVPGLSMILDLEPGIYIIKTFRRCKNIMPDVFTKSGIMVGFGETKKEVLQLMDDLRAANVDFLTIGQYLRQPLNTFQLRNLFLQIHLNFIRSMLMVKGS